jgi:hypothetical protein
MEREERDNTFKIFLKKLFLARYPNVCPAGI